MLLLYFPSILLSPLSLVWKHCIHEQLNSEANVKNLKASKLLSYPESTSDGQHQQFFPSCPHVSKPEERLKNEADLQEKNGCSCEHVGP